MTGVPGERWVDLIRSSHGPVPRGGVRREVKKDGRISEVVVSYCPLDHRGTAAWPLRQPPSQFEIMPSFPKLITAHGIWCEVLGV